MNSCYECLFEDLENEDLSCRESAIASPLVGAIGSLMAIEVIKATIEKNFESYFMIFDSLKEFLKELIFIKIQNVGSVESKSCLKAI